MAIRNYDKITERELSDIVDFKLNYLGNKKLSENLIVKGNHGVFKDGDIIVKGTRVQDVIQGMLNENFELPYKFPTLKITGIEESIEVGNIVSLTPIVVFEQNDAGPITRFVLEQSTMGGDYTVLYDEDKIVTHTDPSVSIIDALNLVSYRATVWFDDGPIKIKDGKEIPGNIEAGSISTVLTVSGIRKCFYGAESGIKFPVENSNQLRALPKFTITNVEEGDSIKLEIPTGTTRITFAYPSYIRDLQKITSKKLGYDVKDVFEKSSIRTNGDNGYTDIEYKVFTYIPDTSYPSDDTYTFEL